MIETILRIFQILTHEAPQREGKVRMTFSANPNDYETYVQTKVHTEISRYGSATYAHL